MLVDETAALHVSHRLEPIVRPELAIDVVQVVAERLGGDGELAGNCRRVIPLSEQLEDATLLVRKWFDACGIGHTVAERHELAGNRHHLVEQRFLLATWIDVAS